MWKTSLQRACREVRFVVKDGVEHHGLIRFVKERLPEIRGLNPNTFFVLAELSHDFKSPGQVEFHFGDREATYDEIPSANVTYEQWLKIFRDQVERGLRLEHPKHESNITRDTPFDIVYAHEHNAGMDDDF